MGERAEGFWWVRWYGDIRADHPWQVLYLTKEGAWRDGGGRRDPSYEAWQWGPYLGKEPGPVDPRATGFVAYQDWAMIMAPEAGSDEKRREVITKQARIGRKVLEGEPESPG